MIFAQVELLVFEASDSRELLCASSSGRETCLSAIEGSDGSALLLVTNGLFDAVSGSSRVGVSGASSPQGIGVTRSKMGVETTRLLAELFPPLNLVLTLIGRSRNRLGRGKGSGTSRSNPSSVIGSKSISEMRSPLNFCP